MKSQYRNPAKYSNRELYDPNVDDSITQVPIDSLNIMRVSLDSLKTMQLMATPKGPKHLQPTDLAIADSETLISIYSDSGKEQLVEEHCIGRVTSTHTEK